MTDAGTPTGDGSEVAATDPAAWEALRSTVWHSEAETADPITAASPTATPGAAGAPGSAWVQEDTAPTWAPAAGEVWPEPAPPTAGSSAGSPVPGAAAAAPAAGAAATSTLVSERPAAGTDTSALTVAQPAVEAGGPQTTTPSGHHKVVPRPAGQRGRRRTAVRPSQMPYRVGAARRIRSSLALLVLTAVLALVVAAVAVAVVAAVASAISGAASS